VVKLRLQFGFDFHRLLWHGDAVAEVAQRQRVASVA